MAGRVFVTGFGLITAIGCNVAECLESIEKQHSGLGEISYVDTQNKGIIPVCEVKRSDKQLKEMAGIPPDKIISRTLLLGLIAAKEAFQMAALSDEAKMECGLISANTVGGMDRSEQFYVDFLKDKKTGKLADVVGHECGYSTEYIAEKLGIQGGATTISTACSSSANAIMLGARLIKNRRIKTAIVGGCDALAKFTINGFSSLKILDKDGCKPFDENRSGLNLGEGAGYLVLESEDSVSLSGKTPICEITGYANTCDAYHQTASSPDGDGSYRAMRDALFLAGLDWEKIDYINAHGTGTQNNDLSEGNAIERLFGKAPLFSSTKPFTGHTLGAAGGVEAVLSCLSICKKIVYPNLRWQEPIKELSIKPNTKLIKNLSVSHVLSNSFGFGGNDTSLVFSKC
ncbi:beta-ketoacyl-[acyl-carrier-protein] synthase family protein [bacterium]|nr:beta-ketoacyl-[acyl-carrier-protein] synthase family protein [bacterium]